MEVSVIGISHRTAPVDMRERFSVPGDLAGRLLRAFYSETRFQEAMVLNTCNRMELYIVANGHQPDPFSYALGHVAKLKQLDQVGDTSAFYRHDGPAAVNHLFRVAASLDSQIVGEHQILGQLKDAYQLALRERTARFLLNKLLHRAFRVGKRVQTETALGRGSVSISQAAVNLAKQVFSSLAGKTAMLVGAGEAAALAARALAREGVSRIVVANRSVPSAEEMADRLSRGGNESDKPTSDLLDDCPEPGPEHAPCPARRDRQSSAEDAHTFADKPVPLATNAIGLSEIPSAIGGVDLVICSTGAPGLVLTCEALGEILRRKNRSVFIVDVAVPRDVDHRLGDLPNVFLYNIDDLNRLVEQNIEQRRREIPRAHAIVETEKRLFAEWLDSRRATATIRLLQQHMEQLQQGQIARYARKFHEKDREELERFAKCLCNKMLHKPLDFLHQESHTNGQSEEIAAVDIIRRIFDLDSLEQGP